MLRARATADERLKETLSTFESAWERHSIDWSQINAKDVIRTASPFAESALVSASNGNANDFTRALSRMRTDNRFPSNDFATIFDRAYNLRIITRISVISGRRIVCAANLEGRIRS